MIFRRGQTLLELVIASGVLATSVIAALTLIVRTITVGQASNLKTDALNYAREGIEVVRMIRDSNWLKIEANVLDSANASNPPTTDLTHWDDDGLTAGYVGMSGDYVLTFDPTRITDAGGASQPGWRLSRVGSAVISVRAFAGTTFATQACAGSCVATPFSRIVRITPSTESAGIAGSTANIDYLDVQSTVTWPTNHGTQQVQLRTRLYNWR